MSAGGRAGRYDEVGLGDTVGESMKVTSAPKHNVSTSMLDGGDGVIFSILPPPNAASRVDAKELDFGLI